MISASEQRGAGGIMKKVKEKWLSRLHRARLLASVGSHGLFYPLLASAHSVQAISSFQLALSKKKKGVQGLSSQQIRRCQERKKDSKDATFNGGDFLQRQLLSQTNTKKNGVEEISVTWLS
ncbi:hypothetical protein Bca4012_030299 [Brassica carinata]|uniref:(rape) hypothetical protein n=1 Tax=Brassica napus TaxID=3708 RepID=A0A078JYG2_BRANA|nr:unnamed protein product [Brassica napus]CDY70531.1 BnaCnng68760D [Brassica napus]